MTSSPLTLLLVALGLMGLSSCSSFQASMQKATKPVQAFAKTNFERLKNLRFGEQSTNSPPVVKVRREDMREIQTGQDRILAWNRARRAGHTASLSIPEDFDPAKLPVGSVIQPSGILPPLHSSSAKNRGSVERRPELNLPE